MYFAALYTIAILWKQPKCPSIDEWIKKISIYAHNKILFGHKNERNLAIFKDMDGAREYSAK